MTALFRSLRQWNLTSLKKRSLRRVVSEAAEVDGISDGNSDGAVQSEAMPAPFFCGKSSCTLLASHLILDCVQLECPVQWTKRPRLWKGLARALLSSFEKFVNVH